MRVDRGGGEYLSCSHSDGCGGGGNVGSRWPGGGEGSNAEEPGGGGNEGGGDRGGGGGRGATVKVSGSLSYTVAS